MRQSGGDTLPLRFGAQRTNPKKRHVWDKGKAAGCGMTSGFAV
jgi:hypothetical protein